MNACEDPKWVWIWKIEKQTKSCCATEDKIIDIDPCEINCCLKCDRKESIYLCMDSELCLGVGCFILLVAEYGLL